MSEFFDAAAPTWDTKHQRIAQAGAIAEIIERALPLTKTTKALEFGCGTGLLGFNLIDKVGELTFSDTSRGMLSEVENKLKLAACYSAKILDLNVAKISDDYDLIFSSMVLHHIADHAQTIAKLSNSLHPDGYLCICDLDKEDGTFHSKETVPHHGFERTEIQQLFQHSGLNVIHSCTGFVNRKIINGQEIDFPVFVLIGQKLKHCISD
nr:class I SAM-dependent methyltransferase [uncultured Tolumonas sp.]